MMHAFVDEYIKIAGATERAIARGGITAEEVQARMHPGLMSGVEGNPFRSSGVDVSGMDALNRAPLAGVTTSRELEARGRGGELQYELQGHGREGRAEAQRMVDKRQFRGNVQMGTSDQLAGRQPGNVNARPKPVAGASRRPVSPINLPTETAGAGRGVYNAEGAVAHAAPAAAKAEGTLLNRAAGMIPKSTGGRVAAGVGGLAALGGLAYGAHKLMQPKQPQPAPMG